LIAVAAELEWRAVARGFPGVDETPPKPWTLVELGDRTHGVLTGVSKSNAAAGVSRVLDPAKHRLVMSLGIGGGLPLLGGQKANGLEIGSVVVGTSSVFGDEGMPTPAGWVSIDELGFAVLDGGDAVAVDARAVEAVSSIADCRGVIATLSEISGTDSRAVEIVRRTGAAVEAMEGAAVGLVAQRLGVAFVEVRVVSNMTGDRDRQRWHLELSMARLEAVARRL